MNSYRRAQQRARMMEVAEGAIEGWLNWQERHERPTLSEIEEGMLRLRQELSERLVEMTLLEQEARAPVSEPACGRCGSKMENKGEREKTIETQVGAVKAKRHYYQCPECGAGIFPPG
jgi:uncharacterized protein with PIN domain